MPNGLGLILFVASLGKGFYSLQSDRDPSNTIKRIYGAHLKPYNPPLKYDVSSGSPPRQSFVSTDSTSLSTVSSTIQSDSSLNLSVSADQPITRFDKALNSEFQENPGS